MKKVILTALIISIVSLLPFSAFMFIYRSFQQKEASNNLLSVIEKMENELMFVEFNGDANIDEINDYCRIMWGLDREIVSIEEYSIYDLDGIPVYEIIFEWKKHYPSLSDPEHIATQLFGKYREPGDNKWIYFRSPEVIRQNFRNLLRDGFGGGFTLSFLLLEISFIKCRYEQYLFFKYFNGKNFQQKNWNKKDYYKKICCKKKS